MGQKMFSFAKFYFRRKMFLENNKDKDYVYIKKNSRVLLSCPHGVEQTRLGMRKVAEIGALATLLEIAERVEINVIAKTSNNFDDANFDEESPYKKQNKKRT